MKLKLILITLLSLPANTYMVQEEAIYYNEQSTDNKTNTGETTIFLGKTKYQKINYPLKKSSSGEKCLRSLPGLVTPVVICGPCLTCCAIFGFFVLLGLIG